MLAPSTVENVGVTTRMTNMVLLTTVTCLVEEMKIKYVAVHGLLVYTKQVSCTKSTENPNTCFDNSKGGLG